MRAPCMRLSAFVGALLLFACGGKEAVKLPVRFDAAEARAMLKPGSNQLVGSAVLRLSSGAVISCAGERVNLYPATAFAQAWVRALYEGEDAGAGKSPPDFAYRPNDSDPVTVIGASDFLAVSRSVPCDADGRFEFDAVGEGDFFVIPTLAWQSQFWDEHHFFHGHQYHDRGGTVVRKVHLQGGQPSVASFRWKLPNSRWNLW